MIELRHSQVPVALANFLTTTPSATVTDWNSATFHPVKLAVKAQLNADQNGLCAYCEKPLAATDGQVDHIKPKAGANAHPHLCFTYSNYAHSCITQRTCGQKKGDGLLPIEPRPGCNSEWALSTDGTIEPLPSLTRARKHAVKQTRDMLGLNADPALVDERRKWLSSAIAVLQATPNQLNAFLNSAPYRYILATAL